MQLEFKSLADGLFVAGLTLRELLVLPPFSATSRLRLVKYDDIDPLEKKAKSLGLKISWSGHEPLELPRESISKLFGDDKWATLEIEAQWDGPDRAPVTLAGWENRYWKLQGLQEAEDFVKTALMQRFDLKPARAAEISRWAGSWIGDGVYLRRLPEGTVMLAAMLRARSRVFLGLPPGAVSGIPLRTLKPGDAEGTLARGSLLNILTLEQALYDRLALGAALIFLLLALACAGLATAMWKMHQPVTGAVFAVLFILSAVYGMRLAGARED